MCRMGNWPPELAGIAAAHPAWTPESAAYHDEAGACYVQIRDNETGGRAVLRAEPGLVRLMWEGGLVERVSE